jgi:hypothetical protein
MDDLEREKSCPYRDSNSDPSAVQPVASRYTDYAILALIQNVFPVEILNSLSKIRHINRHTILSSYRATGM